MLGTSLAGIKMSHLEKMELGFLLMMCTMHRIKIIYIYSDV